MKKLIMFISMFLFMTNVSALTFNVELTNIEDKGNNGTIGSITNIDIPNKTIDAYFQDIGDEVSFDLTVTNSGDRAGTLRSITIASTNDKISYTNNLPENGLAINGNDTNTVTITAKVLEGAVNGTSSSEIKITYDYDEGSCPEGEILSDDESMCLCPEGTERNEEGICVTPEKPIECAPGEIYNETKKICEKKIVPVNPSNPKTLDNIILITLLFVVSGLGIYAVMFKKLKTNKKKATAGIITGVVTLSLSFTVLVSMFGLDNLLGAIVNPITKSKEITVTVNETIDLIVTWDGDCDVTGALTPSNVFEGGSGTESDPYQIKTANQLACFAKSVNEGETYAGKFVKQIKNIKLNDNLNEQAEAGDLSNANVWTTAGYGSWDSNIGGIGGTGFSGTYDGDNHVISGLYLTENSSTGTYYGMFGYVENSTLKNMILSDVYFNLSSGNAAALIGYSKDGLTVDNVKTYGKGATTYGAGMIVYTDGTTPGSVMSLTNLENNIDLDGLGYTYSGIVNYIYTYPASSNDEPNIIFRNVTNNGNFTTKPNYGGGGGGILGYASVASNILFDNVANNGDYTTESDISVSNRGGIAGELGAAKVTFKDSYNTGDITNINKAASVGGLVAYLPRGGDFENCYNSGNIVFQHVKPEGLTSQEITDYGLRNGSASGVAGIVGSDGLSNAQTNITNCFNTGDLKGPFIYGGGIIGYTSGAVVDHCYNTGELMVGSYSGGIISGANGGTVYNSYNTGDITLFYGIKTGGISGGWSGDVENCYNTGDITITSVGGGPYAGGICSQCGTIKNSYNRGNITSKNSAVQIGGIAYQATVINTYNSGDVTFLDELQGSRGSMVHLGGIIGASGTVKYSYNLGDVTAYGNASFDTYSVHGFGRCSVENSVNAGNVTLNINSGTAGVIFLNGISWETAKDSFNAGIITLNDPNNSLTTQTKNIRVSTISDSTSSRGNKWNTDPSLSPLGCYPNAANDDSCTAEVAALVGTYTDEETPSILSVINGDDAYNSELDEDGLPTLKVFNN